MTPAEFRDLPVVRRIRHAGRDIIAARAELAQAFLLVAGWVLLTFGVAQLLPRGHVWPLSGGLFFLSLAGWEWLALVARRGLYKLNADQRRV